MIPLPKKTREVADLLGTLSYRLYYLISVNKLPAPHRDGSGDFAWLPDDISRARAVLEGRQRKAVLS